MSAVSHNRYFIQEHLFKQDMMHGGVGCADAEKILKQLGHQPIIFPFRNNFSLRAKWARGLHLVRTLLSLPAYADVVFQAPLHARIHGHLVRLLRRYRKNIRVICFITDIDGIRDADPALLQKEKTFYALFDAFIVHNPVMKNWLLELKPQAETGIIEFFDFLATPNRTIRKKETTIAFAGNLQSAPFVQQLHSLPDVQFHVYGEGNSLPSFGNTIVRHAGASDPHLLAQTIEGAFGLVWNGGSLTGLEGGAGEYLTINSPHKLSSYIVSGLPVIVPETAAAAHLVRQYEIGFTINSLFGLKEKIDQISDSAYAQMQQNCFHLAERICSGGGLKKALRELELKHPAS